MLVDLPRDIQVSIMSILGGTAQLNTLSKSMRLSLDIREMDPIFVANFTLKTYQGAEGVFVTELTHFDQIRKAFIALIKMNNIAAFKVLMRRKGFKNMALQAAVSCKSVEMTKIALYSFKNLPTTEELMRTEYGQEIYALIK